MSPPKYDPIEIARSFLFVREAATQNRGLRVEAIQHWSAGEFGDSWCAEFLTMVLDIAYQGNAPIPRQGSCEAIRQIGLAKGWITTQPSAGDIYLRVTNNHAHHIGFLVSGVPATGTFVSLSGNTNTTGASNGDGVYEHPVISMDSDTFIHLPE